MEGTATPEIAAHGLETGTVVFRLAVTALFVAINGFFVATEFALVKVRRSRIDAMAREGNRRAKMTKKILERLDLYLSACQLGITLASLILGWLAEPAVAELLVAAAHGLGWGTLHPTLVHTVSLGIALAVVTLLHMVLGEQAPKIWAIQRAEGAAMTLVYPLWGFALVLRPFIWLVNTLSNSLLRSVGVHAGDEHDAILDAQEIRDVISASASAGHVTARQRALAENVLDMVHIQVRHIMLPRVDVVFLRVDRPVEENLAVLRKHGHSRFPLCEDDLDSVVGIVHARTVLSALLDGETPDLRELARKPVFVPETAAVSRFILDAQRSQAGCVVVVDEHGTAVGLAFLDDALEEIVGPIHDEFDVRQEEMWEQPDGTFEVAGAMSVPELETRLSIQVETTAATVGGFIIEQLGHLAQEGESVDIGRYTWTVLSVSQNRIERLHMAKRPADEGDEASV